MVRSQPAYEAAESERAEAVALLVPEVEDDREDAARCASAAAATKRGRPAGHEQATESGQASAKGSEEVTCKPRPGRTLDDGQHRRALHAVDFNRFNRLGTLFDRGHRPEEAHSGVR
jgi:hypothetical protein